MDSTCTKGFKTDTNKIKRVTFLFKFNEKKMLAPFSLAAALAMVSMEVSGFYLPGIAPKDFKANDPVPLHVNALEALKSAIPYDYYNSHFHFCQPTQGIQSDGESLGSVLLGDRLKNSPFDVHF